jgi:hypothetical protein
MERGAKSLRRDCDRKKPHPSSAIAAAVLNSASVCRFEERRMFPRDERTLCQPRKKVVASSQPIDRFSLK